MHFAVLLTESAVQDLEGIYEYITEHDSTAKANYVLDRIEKAFENLSTFPERGSYPHELLTLGIREYRQIFFKPYRIIYRVVQKNVYVYVIADGRRDMQALLMRRVI